MKENGKKSKITYSGGEKYYGDEDRAETSSTVNQLQE